MWPAAQMLADFLAANVECLQGCSCACELGAGLGLVGLFAAQICPVVMTDHNDVVLRVMNKNAVLNQAGHNIRSANAGAILKTWLLMCDLPWHTLHII